MQYLLHVEFYDFCEHETLVKYKAEQQLIWVGLVLEVVICNVNKSESFVGVVTSCGDYYFYSFRHYTVKRERSLFFWQLLM
jgi:hypothetical protein